MPNQTLYNHRQRNRAKDSASVTVTAPTSSKNLTAGNGKLIEGNQLMCKASNLYKCYVCGELFNMETRKEYYELCLGCQPDEDYYRESTLDHDLNIHNNMVKNRFRQYA